MDLIFPDEFEHSVWRGSLRKYLLYLLDIRCNPKVYIRWRNGDQKRPEKAQTKTEKQSKRLIKPS